MYTLNTIFWVFIMLCSYTWHLSIFRICASLVHSLKLPIGVQFAETQHLKNSLHAMNVFYSLHWLNISSFFLDLLDWTQIGGLWSRLVLPGTPSNEFSSWWRHQMETFSVLLDICAGNSPVPSEFPAQRPVTRSFDVFFDLRPNKWLSKQWWGRWFKTPSSPLWRHCNECQISIIMRRHWLPCIICFEGKDIAYLLMSIWSCQSKIVEIRLRPWNALLVVYYLINVGMIHVTKSVHNL